jgi:dephospho-CoA kinase
MLRDAADRFYLPHTRDNLIKISEFFRQTFGEDIMAKTMAKDVQNDTNPVVVVEGIRRMADIAYLQQFPNFVLIEIFADMETRFNRITARRENPDDATKTFDQFASDHQRSTEITIPEVLTHATERIDNNGTSESLHAALDALVQKYLQPHV